MVEPGQHVPNIPEKSINTACIKQKVTEGPTWELILPHTDHSYIKAGVIVFHSGHTQTYAHTHGFQCYIILENSKVKLELLCVSLVCVFVCL